MERCESRFRLSFMRQGLEKAYQRLRERKEKAPLLVPVNRPAVRA